MDVDLPPETIGRSLLATRTPLLLCQMMVSFIHGVQFTLVLKRSQLEMVLLTFLVSVCKASARLMQMVGFTFGQDLIYLEHSIFLKAVDIRLFISRTGVGSQ